MKITKFFLSVLLLLTSFFVNAQERDNHKLSNNELSTQVTPLQAPLTKEQVRHYIKTNILEFKLQQKMKSQADLYDNVIQEFYAKRKILLEQQGWTVEEYEAIEERIFIAQNALEMSASMGSDADFNKEIANVNSNTYLTEKQKSETIKLLRLDRENRLETFVNPSKKDWPAIKAYRKELDHLSDYYAENRPDAPVLK